MKILSPDDIKKDRMESTEESYQRSQAMAVEEARLARLINEARENAQAEIEQIDDDYKKFKTEIEEQRKVLQSEVTGLENRRKEALKPIEALREEAARILTTAEDRAADVERQAQDLAAYKEKNLEDLEKNIDWRDELSHQADKLDEREQFVKNEEARGKHSLAVLNQKWADYHKAVSDQNARTAALDKKEAELVIREKAHGTEREAINKIHQQISNDRKAIQDGYANLARARKEILGRDD